MDLPGRIETCSWVTAGAISTWTLVGVWSILEWVPVRVCLRITVLQATVTPLIVVDPLTMFLTAPAADDVVPSMFVLYMVRRSQSLNKDLFFSLPVTESSFSYGGKV